MAKINLLPWRADRRERRKREFITQLVITAVGALVLVLLWGFWMSLRIDNQNNRNAYLTGQIKQLDAKIVEIKNLQQVKDHLLARKKIIEKLQSSRSQMVHLFDEIVKTIPAGARLTGMTQKGDKLTLNGVAQSNATVAEYMRNIEASPWMGPVHLLGTSNVHANSNTPYEFGLVVDLGVPKTDSSAKGDVKAGSAPAAGSSVAPVPQAAGTAAAAPAPLPLPTNATTSPSAPAPVVPASAGSKAAQPSPAASAAKGRAQP
ncbi:MAG TPA: PilN domain-containing protein [Rhodanobacteraceae bacterium]|jgi:type IV pilus assembly protein PilN|nr:PilN domain-containing protein [Rhodanobacteraceae bacterium]